MSGISAESIKSRKRPLRRFNSHAPEVLNAYLELSSARDRFIPRSQSLLPEHWSVSYMSEQEFLQFVLDVIVHRVGLRLRQVDFNDTLDRATTGTLHRVLVRTPWLRCNRLIQPSTRRRMR